MARISAVAPVGVAQSDINGFMEVYREAFGGEPYNETYTDEQLREIWDEHMANGRIILARDEDSNKVVGFGCSLPLHRAHQDVQDFLAECIADGELLPEDFTFQNTWYMSELGVLESHRNRGIAYDLVRNRMFDVSHSNKRYFIMRTAADKPSNSRHLYEQLGAKAVDRLHDVSETDQVQINQAESILRVYLYGVCNEAIARLDDKIKSEPLPEPLEDTDEDDDKDTVA